MKVYNDGVAKLCIQKKKENDFSAKVNPKTKGDFNYITDICYATASIREEDLQHAERSGRTVTLKIKIPYCPLVKKKMNMVIENILYDIFAIDTSADKSEMYISMEEVRTLAE